MMGHTRDAFILWFFFGEEGSVLIGSRSTMVCTAGIVPVWSTCPCCYLGPFCQGPSGE